MNSINLSASDISHILTHIKHQLNQNGGFDSSDVEQKKAIDKMKLKFGDEYTNKIKSITHDYINLKGGMSNINNVQKLNTVNNIFKPQNMTYSFGQPSKELELDTIELLNVTSKLCEKVNMKGGQETSDKIKFEDKDSIFLSRDTNIDSEQEFEKINSESEQSSEPEQSTEQSTEQSIEQSTEQELEQSTEQSTEQELEPEQKLEKIVAHSIPQEPDLRPNYVEKVKITPYYPQIIMSNSSYTIDSLSN